MIPRCSSSNTMVDASTSAVNCSQKWSRTQLCGKRRDASEWSTSPTTSMQVNAITVKTAGLLTLLYPIPIYKSRDTICVYSLPKTPWLASSRHLFASAFSEVVSVQMNFARVSTTMYKIQWQTINRHVFARKVRLHTNFVHI